MEPYREYQPAAALRPWVRLVWVYDDDAPSPTVQRIPPDGCPELIVHLRQPYEEQQPGGAFAAQPRVIFAGQMTRPIALRAAGPVTCVAFRFEPDGAAAWLGRAMDTATDLRLDMSERISIPAGIDAQTCRTLMESSLTHALTSEGQLPDPEVRAEVRRLDDDDSAARSTSEQRQMQRLFLKHVGVPPRMLRSIFRFRKVFDHAMGAGATWIDAALAAGYFDQPQMARDFRRFLDCTATDWAREQVELGRAMAFQSSTPAE